MTPKACWVLWWLCACLCASVCAYMCLCSLNVCVGSYMCVSLRVHETLPANVTGMSQTVFCGKLKSHDSSECGKSFLYTL